MTSLFVDGIIDENISLLVFVKTFVGNLKFNENESISMVIHAMRMNQDYLDEGLSVDEKPNINITRF